jgi:hypothetical protein
VKRSFLVLGSGLPFEAPLASALSEHGLASLIELGAYRGGAAPLLTPAGQHSVTAERWQYPWGFNGRAAWLFTGAICRRIAHFRSALQSQSGAPPFVILSYPKFAKYLAGVDSARVVYYNQDDNALVRPDGTREELAEDLALLIRSGVIACASRVQAERLGRLSPNGANVIHLPHGIAESLINPMPFESPSPSVVVFGTLSYRYDWAVIRHVVENLSDFSFTFLGAIEHEGLVNSARADLDAVLARPNVNHRASATPQDYAKAGWRAAVHWLPYDVALPFNQACCPLKLFTGLASGRAVLSSRIPEAELHSEWLSLYDTPADAASAIRRLQAGASELRFRDQLARARVNTWRDRCLTLIEVLDRRLLAA